MRSLLPRALRFCVLAVCFAAISQAAHAQSRAPFGVWQGERAGAYLAIHRDGRCFATVVSVVARCEWRPNPDRSGGILTMYDTFLLQPGRIGWSLLWLNRNTLLVNGVERYVRR
jgi:hypothetical protein